MRSLAVERAQLHNQRDGSWGRGVEVRFVERDIARAARFTRGSAIAVVLGLLGRANQRRLHWSGSADGLGDGVVGKIRNPQVAASIDGQRERQAQSRGLAE